MKIRLDFKTPDVLEYALEDVSDDNLKEDIKDICKQWIEYSECISIEIDTDKETARVVSRLE